MVKIRNLNIKIERLDKNKPFLFKNVYNIYRSCIFFNIG